MRQRDYYYGSKFFDMQPFAAYSSHKHCNSKNAVIRAIVNGGTKVSKFSPDTK